MLDILFKMYGSSRCFAAELGYSDLYEEVDPSPDVKAFAANFRMKRGASGLGLPPPFVPLTGEEFDYTLLREAHGGVLIGESVETVDQFDHYDDVARAIWIDGSRVSPPREGQLLAENLCVKEHFDRVHGNSLVNYFTDPAYDARNYAFNQFKDDFFDKK